MFPKAAFAAAPKVVPAYLKPTSLAALFLLAAAFSFTGCKKEAAKATVLAQVGDATLTLEELRESFPAEFEQLIRREQYLDFIKRWMDDEVVYQQALNAKVDADPVVGRKLEKLRRKLLIEEFLSRENASEVFEPDEMAMNQYYEMHKEEFRRKVPEVKFAQIRVQTSKQAADLRYKANRGDFLAVAAANSLDPVPESYSSFAFKKQADFPPCLSQDIAGAGVGVVTLPVACPDGFYLIKVLERQDAGSLISFAEAKEEISGILVMERKDKLLDGRIAKYKEGLSVSYNLDQIPGLAVTVKGLEAPAEPASDSKEKPSAERPASPTRPAEPSTQTPPTAAAAPVKPKAIPTPSTTPAPASPLEARLPREPVPATAAQAAATAGTPAPAVAGTVAPDPRLPREPWEDQQNAVEKPKVPARKRTASSASGTKKPGGDSSEAHPTAKPAEDTPSLSPNTKTQDAEE